MIHIKRREQLDFGYELFIAAVSILSVFNMLLAYIPGVDQDAINVVYIINAVLTLLFVYDFGLRLATAPSRSFYFFRDYGWADLLAVIPAVAHLPAVPDIQGIPDRQKVRAIIYQIVPFHEPGSNRHYISWC